MSTKQQNQAAADNVANQTRLLTPEERQFVIDDRVEMLNAQMAGETAIYKALSAPFPTEALSKDDSRGFALTSIKAQYIVERLNSVLGLGGWSLTGDYNEAGEKGVIYNGQLTIRIPHALGSISHVVSSVGYSDMKRNIGDTYKGARTDALSKAASYLGVGNEVFKGQVDATSLGSEKAATKSVVTKAGATSGSFKKNLTNGSGKTSVTQNPFD